MAQLNDFSKIIHNGNKIGEVLHQGKTIWSDVYLAQDSDFVNIDGMWIYIGAELEVEIPTHINGELVTSTTGMFSGDFEATPVTKVVLNHSNVNNMTAMFHGFSGTTLDLSSFNTSNVTNMSYMFGWCFATTLDLSNFNTSNVTDMSGMFSYSETTTLDLSSFDTSNVTSMDAMFDNSRATTLDLSSFDTSNVFSIGYVFQNSEATIGYAKTQADADKFNASPGKPTGLNFVYLAQDDDFVKVSGYWIYKGSALEVGIPTHINGELVTSTSYMFSGGSTFEATPVTKVVLNHSNVTNMADMFYYSRATKLDLSNFDTSSVTHMGSMFSSSRSTTLDLSSFDTSNVTSMSGMFNWSRATSLDLSSFNTSNVTNMGGMFRSSSARTLDLSSFDTTNVTSVTYMFKDSSATTGYARTQADADKFNESSDKPTGLNFIYLAQDSDFVNVSGFWIYRGSALEVEIPTHINGELVTSTTYMFSGEGEATPVTKVVLNHSNVTDMNGMFSGFSGTTLDLNSFDTSNVTEMSSMFRDSSATTLDLSSFNTSNVTNMSDMFRNSKATTGYARTQADADKFNASSNKPTGLNFVSPYLAQDSDFVKVSGYWVYKGTELEIEIPTHINGQLVTTTQRMFSGDPSYQATPVTKVVLSHSNVTSMRLMFDSSGATTLDLSVFDTSNVTDMYGMFYTSNATTLDLSKFDTSSVIYMGSMFRDSRATKLDLSNFNTSNVTDMSYMFRGFSGTTLDLSSFNTSNVTKMNFMFREASATTLDLSSFDTSKVTETTAMFYGSRATTGYARAQADANKFNASSNKPAGLNFVSPYLAQDSDFVKVSGFWTYKGTESEIEIPTHINGELVTSTSYMFSGDFEATPVTKVVLNHSDVTSMRYMFYYSRATSLDLSSFDTSNVTDMNSMFYSCKATTLDLSNFNTSSVTNMSVMFGYSRATTLDLSNFDTSNVTYMTGMFRSSNATTLDLSNFDTSNVLVMADMFFGSKATTLDLSNFNTSNVFNMSSMFNYSSIKTLDLSSFNTSNVTNMNQMFRDSGATTLDLSSFDTSKVTNMSDMFRNCKATTGYARTQADADKFNASSSKPTGLNFVVPVYLAQDSDFVELDGIWIYKGTELEVEIPTHINGELVTSTSCMFSGHPYFESTPVTKVVLKHSNVTDMNNMFLESSATTIDLSIFDTSNVTDMGYMFASSSATILDLSSFDTSSVTNMFNMFEDSKATSLDLSSFNTSNVTDMSNMFTGSEATTLDLSEFDTSKVTHINFIFTGSKATTGYAKTQADADKFNASPGKPTGLNFVVK